MLIRKAFQYRAYPNKTQTIQLDRILWLCRDLYNGALYERREAWRLAHKSLSCYEQINELPAVKEVAPEYKDVPSHVLQDVIRRLDKAFQAFFRRIKAGQTPGFPRFVGRGRYASFTYPDQAGWKLTAGQLHLTGLGRLRIFFHRPIEGTIKTLTVRRDADHWYISFACEVEIPDPPAADEPTAVGIDLGLLHFATLSTGEHIANPRPLRTAEARLAIAQVRLTRCQKRSKRRGRARLRVSRLHRKVRHQRRDFLHKLSRRLVNEYGLIVFEELAIRNLTRRPKAKVDADQSAAAGETVYAPNGAAAKAGLNKSIHDAGWRMFQDFCASKAAWAGRIVLFVNPAYTSQTCSGCGVIRKKALAERWHSCPECGCELDRDHNAAVNIFRLGLSLRASVEAPGYKPGEEVTGYNLRSPAERLSRFEGLGLSGC